MNCCDFQTKGNLVVCVKCGRTLQLPAHLSTQLIRRTCSSDLAEPLLPCVFTKSTAKFTAWKLYFLTKTEASEYVATVLTPDATRVGTRFASFVSWMKVGSCNCEALRRLLDACPLELIREHHTALVQRIQQSAKQATKLTVPKSLIAAALNLAIRVEES